MVVLLDLLPRESEDLRESGKDGGKGEIGRGIARPDPIESFVKAAAFGAWVIFTVADGERLKGFAPSITDVQKRSTFGGAHPFVAVACVEIRIKRTQIERQHAGCVGSIDQREDAAFA